MLAQVKAFARLARATATTVLEPPPLVNETYDFEITLYARKAVGDQGAVVRIDTNGPPLATVQILHAAFRMVAAENGIVIQESELQGGK